MTVLETNAPSEEERESGATQGAAATQQTSSNITSASCGGDGNGRDNKRISTTSESMVAKPEKPYVGCSDDGLNNLNNGRSRQPNNSSIRSERINGNETSERLKSILYERPGSASNITEMIEKTLLPESPKQGIAVAAAMGGGTGTGGGGRTAFPPGRVSIRDMNYGIPSVAVIGDHVEEVHGESSWRAKVIHFVHQRWLQRVMLALLCLDVIIIFTELFLLSLYPSCDLVVRDCISCCPYDGEAGAHSDPSHSAIRWLAGDDNKHEALCEPGYDEYRGHPSCDSHKWHGVHTTEEVLFWGTITILSLFFLENLSEMMALTPCIYFKQFFLALDFFIITVSLVLELIFHLANRANLEEIAGLLVVVRLWRFVRIGHGLVEVTAELQHENYEDLRRYARECEKQLLDNNVPLPEQTEHVKNLKMEDKLGRLLIETGPLDPIGE